MRKCGLGILVDQLPGGDEPQRYLFGYATGQRPQLLPHLAVEAAGIEISRQRGSFGFALRAWRVTLLDLLRHRLILRHPVPESPTLAHRLTGVTAGPAASAVAGPVHVARAAVAAITGAGAVAIPHATVAIAVLEATAIDASPAGDIAIAVAALIPVPAVIPVPEAGAVASTRACTRAFGSRPVRPSLAGVEPAAGTTVAPTAVPIAGPGPVAETSPIAGPGPVA